MKNKSTNRACRVISYIKKEFLVNNYYMVIMITIAVLLITRMYLENI